MERESPDRAVSGAINFEVRRLNRFPPWMDIEPDCALVIRKQSVLTISRAFEVDNAGCVGEGLHLDCGRHVWRDREPNGFTSLD